MSRIRKHYETLICQNQGCNNKFIKNWGSDRYCSTECYWKAKVKYPEVDCPTCKKKFKPKSKISKKGKLYAQIYCSRICCYSTRRGTNHPRAVEGNRHINSHGYASVLDPEKRFKSGRILEHRLVMEQHLGRKIESDEHIHHVNLVKTDNRIENLKLIENFEHQELHYQMSPIKRERKIIICINCNRQARVAAKMLCNACYKKSKALQSGIILFDISR